MVELSDQCRDKIQSVTAVFLQPLLPGKIQSQRAWLPPSILPKLASLHLPGASSRPKEKLQQQISSHRARSQKPQELMSQLQSGRCTLKVVLVTGVNIQRQGSWGLIVTNIGRKTATGTSVASPSLPHYHQSRLILAKVPGELQAAQHCIWMLGKHWDFRDFRDFPGAQSPITQHILSGTGTLKLR